MEQLEPVFKPKTRKVARFDVMVPVVIQQKVQQYLADSGFKNHALKNNLDKCMWFVANLVQIKGRKSHSFEKKTGLSGEILQRYLGVDGTKLVKKALTETEIISINDTHSHIHGRSKSYGFLPGLFDGEITEYRITAKNLVTRPIREMIGEYEQEIERESYLDIENYGIDYSVYQFLKERWQSGELTPMQYMCHYLRAKEIDFKDFYASRDDDGRLYNNFTNLPKIMRPFITFEGHPITLCEVDVSACMAFILGILLQRDWFLTDDVELFIKMSQEPDFYAKIADQINYHSADLKTDFLTMLNTRNERRKSLEIYQHFLTKFPHVAEFINDTNAGDNSRLYSACIKVESKVMVDMVYMRLLNYKRKVFSIHDGLLTEPQDAVLAEKLIRKGFREEFGVEPVIKIK